MSTKKTRRTQLDAYPLFYEELPLATSKRTPELLNARPKVAKTDK